ncbi:MAG: T9SS type A sorting domain-containing protein [Terrimonas sp.]|nr:T9SS type A sorting domain-containing protein [Terrimonas sp.]
MKNLYLLIAIIFTAFTVAANPVITVIKNEGKWKTNSSWDLNRKPKNGDTILIPVGFTVVLDNTQNLNNVYIMVLGVIDLDGGKLKLDDNSTVEILSSGAVIGHGNNSEYIKIGNEYKFKGTANYQGGPSIANASTGAYPSGFESTGSASLPVKFVGFNVARQDKNILIQWSTSQEYNSNHYEVERSENGISWKPIAIVTAAGNSNTIRNYTYTDKSVSAAKVYYRIKQVDIDGRFDFTVVRSVSMETNSIVPAANVKISSGTNNTVYLHFSEEIKTDVMVKILTMNGKLIYQQKISNPVGQQNITVNNNLPKGIYVVSVSDNKTLNTAGQVIL